MRRFFKVGIPRMLIGMGMALLLAAPAVSETLTGRVVGVSDGDTITVLNADHQQFKIRLGGIDAPEKAQPYGQRAKDSLSQLVYGQQVDVHWKKRDRYDRVVGKVMVAEPTCRSAECPRTVDACLSQVTSGMAWWYEKYAKEQLDDDAQRYQSAEQDSRFKQIGLWRDANPTPPWDWRKTKRK